MHYKWHQHFIYLKTWHRKKTDIQRKVVNRKPTLRHSSTYKLSLYCTHRNCYSHLFSQLSCACLSSAEICSALPQWVGPLFQKGFFLGPLPCTTACTEIHKIHLSKILLGRVQEPLEMLDIRIPIPRGQIGCWESRPPLYFLFII